MSNMIRRRTLGILGGMGAKAGAAFYDRLVDLTPADRDQDHIRSILYTNPEIPDRTEGILGGGEDPYPALLSSAKLLEDAGADLIAIACISAHYYIPRLRWELTCDILSAIEETAGAVRMEYPGGSSLGLLATTGTIRSGMYQDALKNYRVITLTEELQETLLMGAIYGDLKAGRIPEGKKKAAEALERIADMGAETVIIGCSELPLVIEKSSSDIPLFDSIEILIRKVVSVCSG